MRFTLALVGTAALNCAGSACGQTPLGTGFTYQGRLDSSSGAASGRYDVRFTLHSAATGAGTVVAGPICRDGVDVADGRFTVPLDFGPTNANFNGEARWLSIEVRADDTPGNCAAGVYTLLAPRQPLTATPYSLQTRGIFVDDAGRVGIGTTSPTSQLSLLGGLLVSDVNDEDVAFSTGVFSLQNSHSQSLAYRYAYDPERHDFFIGGARRLTIASNGNVGIGTANPAATLDVAGRASVTATSSVAVDATNASTLAGAMAVRGVESGLTGNTYGVFGVANSTAGTGVLGRAAAGSGATTGVYGQNLSTSGYGVYGNAQASTGVTYGVFGTAASDDGYGVYGSSVDHVAVKGVATGSSGSNYGVYGESHGFLGFGVYGSSFGALGRGVYGTTFANGQDDTPYGVRGECSTNTLGYAVYAGGDLGASGLKAFRIDHPDDPANKYLLHYSSESPEAVNFYRGTVNLDAAGQALVVLPAYFAKINTSPSYQLTAIGAPMPHLHVAEEISGAALLAGMNANAGDPAPRCTFRIAGGAGGGRVSWRVEALRNDLRVRQHGAPVEREKAGPERGKYQHPEYYGLPAEMGMSARPDAQSTEPR